MSLSTIVRYPISTSISKYGITTSYTRYIDNIVTIYRHISGILEIDISDIGIRNPIFKFAKLNAGFFVISNNDIFAIYRYYRISIKISIH